MMYFQLLAGMHREKDRTVYHAGDIIGPVDHDLARMFGASKFRRLTDQEVTDLSKDEAPADEQPQRVKRRKKVQART